MAAAAQRIAFLTLLGISLCAGVYSVRPQAVISQPGGCGPLSLYALCQCLGVATSPDRITTLSGGDNPLTSFVELQQAAQQLGLEAQGLALTPAELRRTQPLGILHVDGGHFVAIVCYEHDGLRIANPVTRGRTDQEVWPYANLAGRWDGRILVVAKTSQMHR